RFESFLAYVASRPRASSVRQRNSAYLVSGIEPHRRRLLIDFEARSRRRRLMMSAGKAAVGTAIRPFRVDFPDEALDDMRRRIAATRWPEQEAVDDDSQGVPLALTQELARYSATA